MRQLIIDGNAVYELDENCMLKKKIEKEEKQKERVDKQKREEQK